MLTYVKRTPGQFIIGENGEPQSVDLVEIRCKSADEKPTKGISNGSVCVEMDTRNVFFFDEGGGRWI